MALSKKILGITQRFMTEVFTETGFPVVISDTEGYIIQSTDTSRLGQFHSGARQLMIGSSNEFAITAEQAAADPVAKEGYGCAIVVNGEKVAGFGITGPLIITQPLVKIASQMMNAWITDLKNQEQLERSEKKYRNIFDNSTLGIFQSTFDGKLVTANKALAKMHGYDTPEQFKTQIKNITRNLYVRPEDREELLSRLIEEKSVKNFITSFYHKDGHIIDASLSAHMISDPESNDSFFEGIVEDITERKHAERLKIERDTAKASNEAKSQFLAAMSHEIRTPLNGVIGMTELMLGTDLTSEQLEFAKIIHTSGTSLLSLINDILDYSKMEAGKLDLEMINFDLRVTLETVGDMTAIKAQEKGLEYVIMVHPEVPSLLRGDPGRLRQIIVNLTANAVKFTAKGEIVICVDVEEENKERVKLRFKVTDTGIGIPEDKMDRLFKSFSQVDSSTTRKYGGTGLGLTISQKLAQMMGGRIGVKSRDNVGSEFWFTAEFEKQEQPLQPIFPPKDIQGKYILIVDRNRTNRFVISEQIKSWECRSDQAQNGREALEKLLKASGGNTPFDIAIIDMQLPDMDGKCLGEKIRNDPNINCSRLVMMTAMGERGDARKLEKIGFDAYLTKPIKMSQLHACLSWICSRTKDIEKPDPTEIITQYSLSEKERRLIRILLAEDNRINQKVAIKMLNKLGFQVDVVDNGRHAVNALKEMAYDLVLMDCQMPELDGYAATKEIRSPETGVKNFKVPVIAMTANAMKGDKEKCLEAGMNDYITKPVNSKDLSQMVEKWLLRKKA
ncbi:MAG: response regulator [Proteobacteria bacterium]|nr:response regulator [Pseudomonadota bacterium]MBU1583655.1 response regulator [Pseudomonadota bacterium]MBU2453376.1 response regulator [Pseudomonadota bacterium]MBU2628137.1 response regulator [Pseudomonadota bacterium]